MAVNVKKVSNTSLSELIKIIRQQERQKIVN